MDKEPTDSSDKSTQTEIDFGHYGTLPTACSASANEHRPSVTAPSHDIANTADAGVRSSAETSPENPVRELKGDQDQVPAAAGITQSPAEIQPTSPKRTFSTSSEPQAMKRKRKQSAPNEPLCRDPDIQPKEKAERDKCDSNREAGKRVESESSSDSTTDTQSGARASTQNAVGCRGGVKCASPETKPTKHRRHKECMEEKGLHQYSLGIPVDIYHRLKSEAEMAHTSMAVLVRDGLRRLYPTTHKRRKAAPNARRHSDAGSTGDKERKRQ